MSVENVSYYEDFHEIEKKLWALLTRAVNDRNSEFRTPVFICGDKNNLDGRVVVLRKADEKNLSLQFHSDIRSTKIDTIKNNSNSSLLFYGKKEKIQLRMKVESKLHYNNEITKELVEDCNELKKIGINSVAICSNDFVNYPDDSFDNMIKFSNENHFN